MPCSELRRIEVLIRHEVTGDRGNLTRSADGIRYTGASACGCKWLRVLGGRSGMAGAIWFGMTISITTAGIGRRLLWRVVSGINVALTHVLEGLDVGRVL